MVETDYGREKLCLMLLFISSNCTCMKLEDERLSLPATHNQTKDLAESVCMELFYGKKYALNACIENFDNKTRNTKAAATDLRLACRSSSSASSQSIAITVAPLGQYQLITLINAVNSDDLILNYMLVDPNTSYADITVPMGRYTIWSTVLNDDGSSTLWRRGPEVTPWTELQKHLKQKTYDIKYDFLRDSYVNGTYSIDVRFSWNSFEALDSCFKIINNCDGKTQGDFYEKKIKSYDERVVVVKDLLLDDNCTFLVRGLYGDTSLRYPTLSCAEMPGCVRKTQSVKDIELEAIQGPGDTWSVHVSWSQPPPPPHQYNVTLKAEHLHHKIVPGNTTEVVFPNVTGAGVYAVLVVAQELQIEVARNSRNGLFPPRVIIHEKGGVPQAVIWVLAILSLTALSFGVICWRRRLNYKRRNLYFANELQKITGEIDADDNPESHLSDKWEIHSDRLVLHEIIGEGAFGVVRRGTLAPFKDVAVKMLKDFPSVEEIRSFRSEMELMKSVGAHPHIVSLVGCCSGRRPFILVEYCSRGDLLTFLRCSWDLMTSRLNAKYCNNNNKEINYRIEHSKSTESKLMVNRLYDFQGTCDTELTIVDLLSFCRQIAMGMEFLESNRVVHRDLAARNILVTDNRTLKIADFGLSRDVYQENQYKQKGNGKMPVKWMALESLTHRMYTTHSDVWSFGVVMWEVLTVGGAPYAAVSAARLPRLLAAGYRLPRPVNCSPELYEVMQSCWAARARARPSFAQLHAALDAQLCARADHYLELAVPDLALVPRLQSRSYVRSLARSTMSWIRSKSYERPQANSNHYTVQPALTRDITADMKIP